MKTSLIFRVMEKCKVVGASPSNKTLSVDAAVVITPVNVRAINTLITADDLSSVVIQLLNLGYFVYVIVKLS